MNGAFTYMEGEGFRYNNSEELGYGNLSEYYGSGNEDSYIDDMMIIKINKVFSILFAVQASLSTLLNVLVFATYIHMQKLRKKIPTFLLFCTNVVDIFITGLFWFHFMLSTKSDDDSEYSATIYYAYIMLLRYSFCLSLLTLMLSAIDRYFSIATPFLHMAKVTFSRIRLVYILIWIISTIPVLVRMFLSKFEERNLYTYTDRVYLHIFNAVLLLMIIIVFVFLFKTYRRSQSAIAGSGNLNGEKDVSTVKNLLSCKKKQTRLLKIFSIMMVSYTLSYLPIAFDMTLQNLGILIVDGGSYEEVIITHISDNLYFASAIVNPIITLSMQRDYRNTLLNWFRRQRTPSMSDGVTAFV